MDTLRHLQSAWKRHSLGTFLHLAVKNAVHYSKEALSGRLFAKPETRPSEFDAALGTDTESIRELWSLDVDEATNARHAHHYQASPHAFTTKIIAELPIDHSRFSFLDFGAGKGRVLLIAAQWPFTAVIGIEFARELCEIASENLKKISADKRRAGRVECAHDDATRYPLPDGPMVCYFYNPFGRELMAQMAEKLEANLKSNPREVYVVYAQPDNRVVFDAKDYWEVIDSSTFHVTYRAQLEKLAKAA
jgi:SAM-dependent methyltransferase